MFIKEFHITNFKSFKDVTFHFNRDINIFTGLNNAGKTTTIEALSLWVECFTKLCRRAERSDQATRLERNMFRLGLQKQNYFEQLTSVHITHHHDIFYQLDHRNSITLNAKIEHENSVFELGFEIFNRGVQYEINLLNPAIDYSRFNQFFQHLPRAITAAYVRPVTYLESSEEFQTAPKIQAMQDAHRAVEVTRNRISRLLRGDRFGEFLERLAYILSEGNQKLTMSVHGQIDKDIDLRIMVKIGIHDTPKEIALLGSGSLQIITVLLGCYEQNVDLNLILLDEPDSHIHRDIQKRLMFTLRQLTGNMQIFLTTHNESLIRSAEPKDLFHLEQRAENSYRPIVDLPLSGLKKGFQPRPEWAILRSLGNSSALDFVSALESDRLYLVEGMDDAAHLNALLPQTQIAYRAHHMFWSFDGISNFFKNISAYKDIFSLVKNERSLWEKSTLILDKDWLTDDQRQQQMAFLRDKFGIPVHIWSGYTFESLFLQDPTKLARLLGRYLNNDDFSSIENQLRNEIQKQALSLRTMIRAEDKQKEIYNWLCDRRDKLDALGNKGGRHVLPERGLLQPRFKEYAEAGLNEGRIDHLADKDIFYRVIHPVIQAHSQTAQTVTLLELLQHVDPGSFLTEWQTALFPTMSRT